MKNYFNFKRFLDKILITNDCGHYMFLSQEEFREFVMNQISLENPRYEEFVKEGFIYEGNKMAFISGMELDMRKNKRYLYSGTSLFIFVLTDICNMSCVYCQAQSSTQQKKGKMENNIAEMCVDYALQSPEKRLQFEFQGGEPLLNFSVLLHIVEYSQKKKKEDVIIEYSLVTNGTFMGDETLRKLMKNKVSITTSLDGNNQLHNSNRILNTTEKNKNSFDYVYKLIKECQQKSYPIGAIQTTTKNSLNYEKQIVDTYKELELHSIFIRPLTPLGYAKENWDEIGYTPEQFVEFYKKVLYEIIKVNETGYYLVEGHARIFLKKILGYEAENYMELRSPCGAAYGQIAFYYDGNIFTCDEARMAYEMGEDAFCIGNVKSSDYNEGMDSSKSKAVCSMSVLESLPGCCDCVYSPYCGVCPIITYMQNQDVFSNKYENYRCKIYKGMLDTIFEMLYQNKEISKIFHNWCMEKEE